MHFIIGAFVAGLFFSARTRPDETFGAVQSKVSGLTKGLLAPIFFASIGLHLDLGAVLAIPVFTGLLLLVALAGKILGAGGVAALFGMGKSDAARIGVAMSARGAVELIIAGIAMRAGLFSEPQPAPPVVEHLFSAVVLMAIVTTLLTPIALRLMMPSAGDAGTEPASSSG
jgi:Kef-type K+ transport system membrane component KefB